MNTVYLFDPMRSNITPLLANLEKRTVEALTGAAAPHPSDEFTEVHSEAKNPSHGRASLEYRQSEQSAKFSDEAVAGDLMVQPFHSLAADDSVRNARALLDQHSIRHLPVSQNGRITGLLTETELWQAPATSSLGELCQPFLIVLPQTRASALALLFMTQDQSACLVRSERGIDGIVTDHDLLKCLLPDMPEQEA